LDLADMGRSMLRPYMFCERFLRLQIKKNGVPVWPRRRSGFSS
jgi:hypothetical protein